jgi:hypothetical protein
MTKMAFTFILLSTLNGLYAMDNVVTLASQEELKKRLNNDVGVPHFVETTNIDRMLGSRKVVPLEVTALVDFALLQYSEKIDFNEEIQTNFANQFMQSKRNKMITAILQEHPEAIDALKKNGSLEKK